MPLKEKGKITILTHLNVRAWSRVVMLEGDFENGYQAHKIITRDKVVHTSEGTKFPKLFGSYIKGIQKPQKKSVDLISSFYPSTEKWLTMCFWRVFEIRAHSDKDIAKLFGELHDCHLFPLIQEKDERRKSWVVITDNLEHLIRYVKVLDPADALSCFSILLLKAELDNTDKYKNQLMRAVYEILINCSACYNELKLFNNIFTLFCLRFDNEWRASKLKFHNYSYDKKVPINEEMLLVAGPRILLVKAAIAMEIVPSSKKAYRLLVEYSKLPEKTIIDHVHMMQKKPDDFSLLVQKSLWRYSQLRSFIR